MDNRTFLVWIVQQLATCNLAQLGFIARLVNEYLDGMVVTRSIARPFVEMCLGKVSEVRLNPSSRLRVLLFLICVYGQIAAAQFRPVLPNTDAILRTSLKVGPNGIGRNRVVLLTEYTQRVCLAFSDAFVSPRIWDTHSILICEVMWEDGNVPESPLVAEQIRFAQNTLHRNLADIRSRCEAMLFRNFPSLEVAKSDWSILDVKVCMYIQWTCDYG